jgi:tripartite-type tricarboxylate transporter receptor subunit TctC
MTRRFLLTLSVVISLLVAAPVAFSAPYYEGKTVRITVGFSAGGGFDLWARVVARHLGRNIPGRPTVIVENITGAGGLIQANQLFRATKADGLTIGHPAGALIFSQMMGQPGYEFDSQKFVYIAAVNKENNVFVFTKKSGIASVDRWRASASPVKVGGLVPGNFIDNCARVMKDVLGFPTQIITGYKGTADIRIATESGELAGGAAGWDGVKTSWKRSIDSGEAIVLLQCVPKRLNELPNVPLMIELATTDQQRKLVEVIIHCANDFSRPFVVPPGTPRDRVDLLRKAFQDMVKDKEFMAEIEKMQLSLDPATGEQLSAAAAGVARLDQATRANLKDVLFK